MRRICLSLLLLTAPALADVLHLKGGKKLEGKIVDEGSRLAVIDRDQMFVVARDEVARRERSQSFMDVYEARLEALPTDDADAIYDFGRWLDRNRWPSRAAKAYREALEVDEEQRGARGALGYRLYEGEWHSPDELNRAKGLKKFEGRWYTPHDLNNLRKEIAQNEQVRAQRAAIQRVNRHVNGIVRRFATFDKKARQRAYEDLRRYADQLIRSEELRPLAPRLRKLAHDVKAYYDYMHHVLCARMLARTEVQATHTQLKTPIETFETPLGAAITLAAAQSPVNIQLPELRIAQVKTTVDIPAGCK
ncbi:MAG: hypothetical protein ACE5JG_03910 [Planctomycetota bacterium]